MKKIIYILSIVATANCVIAQNKVGINKKPTDQSPLRAEVDVNGNVSIENVPLSNNVNLQPLLISNNEDSKRLQVYPAGKKPYTLLNFKLNTYTNSDWLLDVNTQISNKKYFLLIANAYLANKDWEQNISTFPNNIVFGTSHTFRNGNNGHSAPVYNAIQNVNLSTEGYEMDNKGNIALDEDKKPIKDTENWHLSADFPGSYPLCLNNTTVIDCHSYWYVTLLAIDNKYVKELHTFTSNSDSDSGVNIIDNLRNSAK